ncbi:MAG: hypothetical protein HYT71_03485 [Candidatus Aenigmarchaeota archaeon]|nr:hypothetical protein [Candidatus Aenigmarchaeota archaeon]
MVKSRTLSATGKDVVQVIEQWQVYLKRKGEADPLIGRRGIVGSKLAPDYELPPFETRTVMFSLVEGVAPELVELGKLVDAKRPHVYVEGVREPGNDSNDCSVFFDELYSQAPPSMLKNPDKIIPYNLIGSVHSGSRFVLRVYAANDLDITGKVFEDIDAKDVIVFKDWYGSHKSMTVRSGWRTLRHVPFAGVIHSDKHPYIAPSTSSEIEIVYNGFVHAVSALSKL